MNFFRHFILAVLLVALVVAFASGEFSAATVLIVMAAIAGWPDARRLWLPRIHSDRVPVIRSSQHSKPRGS